MNYKPIIIVAGEPNSIFFELFLKTVRSSKIKSPIILIGSKKLFLKQAKILNKKVKFELINQANVIKKKVK